MTDLLGNGNKIQGSLCIVFSSEFVTDQTLLKFSFFLCHSIRFDALIESLFSYKTASKISANSIKSKSEDNSNSGQSAQMFILDPRNSQNMAIVLKSLAVSPNEILKALLGVEELTFIPLKKLKRLAQLKKR